MMQIDSEDNYVETHPGRVVIKVLLWVGSL